MPTRPPIPRIVPVLERRRLPVGWLRSLERRLGLAKRPLTTPDLADELGVDAKTWEPEATRRPEARADADVVVRETWLEVPIEEAWLAAYRVVEQEGLPAVAELRIFPAEPDAARPPGEWSAQALGEKAPVPRGGLTTRRLRTVQIAKHLALIRELTEPWLRAGRAEHARFVGQTWPAARRWFREEMRRRRPNITKAELDRLVAWSRRHVFSDPLDADWAPRLRALAREVRTKPGRRGRPQQFYAGVAEVYAQAWDRGSRHPTADAAKRLRVSPERARDLVREARQRGLLSPALPGRPGGELTDRARRLLGRLERTRPGHPQGGRGGPGAGQEDSTKANAEGQPPAAEAEQEPPTEKPRRGRGRRQGRSES
jgi:hypothetical protein